MKLLDLVQERAIVAQLDSDERNGAIRELVQVLALTGQIKADTVDSVTRQIIQRERTRGTTGIGKGMALPHAKVESLPRVIAAVGRSAAGIDFASLDGEPVFGVFLILSPVEQAENHLKAMDLVFRHLLQEKFRRFLRQSDTPEKIYDLLREADEQPLVA